MTDLEKLKQCFDEIGVEYVIDNDVYEKIELMPKDSKVYGINTYRDTFFYFNKDGSFETNCGGEL